MLGGCRRSPGPLAGRPAADPWDLAARRCGGCRCVPCASGAPGWRAARHLAVAGRLWGRPCPVRPVPDPGGGAPVAASRWSGTLRCQTTGYAQGMGEYGQVECRALALGEEEASFSFRLYLTDASPDLGPGQTLQVEARLDRAPLDSLRGFSKQGQFLTARQIGGLEVETGSPAWWSWAPRTARHMQRVLCPLAAPAPGGAADRHYHWAKRCICTAQQRRDREFERYFPPDGSIRPACVCIAVAVCAGPGEKRRLGLGRSAVLGFSLAVRLYPLRLLCGPW